MPFITPFSAANSPRMPLAYGQSDGNHRIAITSTSITFVSDTNPEIDAKLGANQRRRITIACTQNFHAHRNPNGSETAATTSDKLFLANTDYTFELQEGETISAIRASMDGALDWYWSGDLVDENPL